VVWSNFVRSNFNCLVFKRDLRFLKRECLDLMGEPFASFQIRVLFLVVMGHASFIKRYAI
jgi:hypothetical protein